MRMIAQYGGAGGARPSGEILGAGGRMRLVIGIDIAKDTHWLTAVTERGEVVLDRAVPNEPAALEEVVAALRDRGAERVFGIDVLGGIATLALAVLLANEEQVVYVPGLAVNRARDAEVGGETKSDSRDARVIAQQVRTRRALRPLRPDNESFAAVRVLVTRRR